MRLAVYEPDIPQNLGALIRLASCFRIPLDIVGPCGFPLGDREVRRVAMDYGPMAEIVRHDGWDTFRPGVAGRLVLLTTRAPVSHVSFDYAATDTLLVGRESAGVTDTVRAAVDAEVRVPLAGGARSLNVAIAAAMVLGEALRQTGGFEVGTEEGPA
jgi:tRNA (cytidine/uridine-2'-O-)-methyltransferase